MNNEPHFTRRQVLGGALGAACLGTLRAIFGGQPTPQPAAAEALKPAPATGASTPAATGAISQEAAVAMEVPRNATIMKAPQSASAIVADVSQPGAIVEASQSAIVADVSQPGAIANAPQSEAAATVDEHGESSSQLSDAELVRRFVGDRLEPAWKDEKITTGRVELGEYQRQLFEHLADIKDPDVVRALDEQRKNPERWAALNVGLGIYGSEETPPAVFGLSGDGRKMYVVMAASPWSLNKYERIDTTTAVDDRELQGGESKKFAFLGGKKIVVPTPEQWDPNLKRNFTGAYVLTLDVPVHPEGKTFTVQVRAVDKAGNYTSKAEMQGVYLRSYRDIIHRIADEKGNSNSPERESEIWSAIRQETSLGAVTNNKIARGHMALPAEEGYGYFDTSIFKVSNGVVTKTNDMTGTPLAKNAVWPAKFW